MSYVIPNGIQTKADAVLAVASVIADEDKSALGDGSVNTALDVLADTLAGQNVEVPATNVGAILALAQYVGGGGAQKHPIIVEEGSQGNIGFYIRGTYGQWDTPVTELEGGTPFVIIENDHKALTKDTISVETGDGYIPVMYNFEDASYMVYAIMPNLELSVYASVE